MVQSLVNKEDDQQLLSTSLIEILSGSRQCVLVHHHDEETMMILTRETANISKPTKKDLAHAALSLTQFLSQKQITVVDHPPYLPDLALCDLWLLLRLKNVIKGMYFGSVDEIHIIVISH